MNTSELAMWCENNAPTHGDSPLVEIAHRLRELYSNQLPELNDKQPTPNPHYKIDHQWSMDGGNAIISIPAPGGHIDPIEAADLLDFLDIVARQIKRVSAP